MFQRGKSVITGRPELAANVVYGSRSPRRGIGGSDEFQIANGSLKCSLVFSLALKARRTCSPREFAEFHTKSPVMTNRSIDDVSSPMLL